MIPPNAGVRIFTKEDFFGKINPPTPEARFTPQQEANSHRGHSSTQLNPPFGPKVPVTFPFEKVSPIRQPSRKPRCAGIGAALTLIPDTTPPTNLQQLTAAAPKCGKLVKPQAQNPK